MKLLKVQISNFATKMAAASTKNTKDSAGKRLGIKTLGGHEVYPNDILIKQRGFKWKPGLNTFYTVDQTIHSKVEGVVKFTKEFLKQGKITRKLTYIHVIPKTHNKKEGVYNVPYCYHPELYPELAQFNPQFTNWDVKKSVVRKDNFRGKKKLLPHWERFRGQIEKERVREEIERDFGEGDSEIVLDLTDFRHSEVGRGFRGRQVFGEKREDFPVKAREGLRGIVLPERVLREREVEGEDEGDLFVKYEDDVNKRIQIIGEHFKNYE